MAVYVVSLLDSQVQIGQIRTTGLFLQYFCTLTASLSQTVTMIGLPPVSSTSVTSHFVAYPRLPIEIWTGSINFRTTARMSNILNRVTAISFVVRKLYTRQLVYGLEGASMMHVLSVTSISKSETVFLYFMLAAFTSKPEKRYVPPHSYCTYRHISFLHNV